MASQRCLSIRIQSPQVEKIAERLTPFEREVFAACLKSFEQSDNPLRVNNFATGLRELSRIMLHDLAPDKHVKACSWFVQEFNEEGKPVITRAQRIRYAVQGGLPINFVQGTLSIDVDETIKEFNQIISKMNKFAHITKGVFGTAEATAAEVADKALDTFDLLLQTIDDCRSQVETALEDRARDALDLEMISNTVQALDEIATHHMIDSTHIDEFELQHLGSDKIVFRASGSVDCELQYGSNSDFARGDGMSMHDNYPLTCEFEAPADSPLNLEVKNLQVDNSSFYE